MEKQVKKLTILVAILSVLLVGVMGYVVYDKFIAKEEVEDKQEENNDKDDNDKKDDDENNDTGDKELDINSAEVLALYQSIPRTGRLEEINGYNKRGPSDLTIEQSLFYTKDKVNVSELNLAINPYFDKFLHESYSNVIEKRAGEYCERAFISETNMNKILYDIFGNNVKLNKYSQFGDAWIIYNENTKEYELDNFCGRGIGSGVRLQYTKLIKAERKSDYIYLYEKLAFVEAYEYVSGNLVDNKSTSIEDFCSNPEKYEDKFSTFMYAFKKDSDGKYHLEFTEYTELKH